VETGETLKSFTKITLRYSSLNHKTSSLKETKAVDVQRAGTRGAGGGRRWNSLPLGGFISLPSTSIELFLGHEAAGQNILEQKLLEILPTAQRGLFLLLKVESVLGA